MSTQPVSYTHLDVYKRQIFCSQYSTKFDIKFNLNLKIWICTKISFILYKDIKFFQSFRWQTGKVTELYLLPSNTRKGEKKSDTEKRGLQKKNEIDFVMIREKAITVKGNDNYYYEGESESYLNYFLIY